MSTPTVMIPRPSNRPTEQVTRMMPVGDVTRRIPVATVTQLTPRARPRGDRPRQAPQRVGEVHDLRLVGRIDAQAGLAAGVIWAVDHGARLVVVDVTHVTEVRQSGLAELLTAIRGARSRRADVRFWGSSSALVAALSDSGLDRVFRVHDDRAAAYRLVRLGSGAAQLTG